MSGASLEEVPAGGPAESQGHQSGPVCPRLPPSESRSMLTLGHERAQLVLRRLLLLRRQADEQGLLRDLGLVLHVEVDEAANLRLVLVRVVLDVDEQGPAERLVGLVLHCLLARSDAAVTAVDLHRLHGTL